MWFVLLQVPISWLLYRLGILKLDTPDAVVIFYLQLWNLEPLFHSKLPKSVMGVVKLAVIGVLGSIFLYTVLGLYWTMRVKAFVPEPYLDEVFHIPQALAYCQGKWDVWDDKITTPAGLYIIAVLYHKLLGHAVCTVNSLRHLNLIGIYFVHHAALLCRKYIEAKLIPRFHKAPCTTFTSAIHDCVSYFNYHSAINIAAFPVLFFFSGLFYTDVFSAVSVLLAYQLHLFRTLTRPAVWNGALVFLLGIAALFMRQTNVFWVAVYLGGLEAIHAVKSLRPKSVLRNEHKYRNLGQLAKHFLWRYSIGDIHDPPLGVSGPDDWLFCALSIAIAIICNPQRVLRQIWPYLSIVGLFASFVGWNGGVVLGDKSNHVATLHLAQMLYIWPFFAFFSAPLLIPPAVSWASSIYTTLCAGTPAEKTSNQSTQTAPAESTPDEVARSPALRAFNFFIRRLSYITFLLGATVLSVGIVKYNTIIHPFTLADNRHYMFYVFRYTIKRSPMIRFALVPVYMISARLVWNRLAGHATNYRGIGPPATYISRPCLTPTLYAYWDEVFMTQPRRPQAQNGQTNTSSDAANPNTATTPKQPPPAEALIDLSHPDSTSTTSPSTSTALLWLATTALSLMTAPLVEPRYFILPWIFWRLLVPAWPTQYTPPARFGRIVGWLADISRRYDLTVALETVWFAAINLATFWVFVNKPFVWTAEDGTLLDGGRTQRFMW